MALFVVDDEVVLHNDPDNLGVGIVIAVSGAERLVRFGNIELWCHVSTIAYND